VDPDACLQRWREAMRDGDYGEASEAHADLRGWIERGGFEPKWRTETERSIILG
jgi:hypothetical protein